MEIYRKHMPKEKRPAGRTPKWTTEFMYMVVQKIEVEGMTYLQARDTFGVSNGSISAWLRKYRKGKLVPVEKAHEPAPDLQIYRLEEQVKELKSEIGDLFLQNQMLKKALYHSQQKKKDSSSVITSKNLEAFQKGVK